MPILRKIAIFFCSMLAIPLWSQKELYISQYLHNQYTVNSAFAGSGEALTMFGAYRKQWSGINGSPQAQLLSTNTPLRNDQVAIGIELFNQSFAVIQNTGFTASYTYRFRQAAKNHVGLSLNGGMSTISSSWQNVPIKDPTDPLFAKKEQLSLPILGVGIAWYGPKFFAGLSTPNLFYADIYTTGTSAFDMGNAEMIATAGYLAQVSPSFQFQPSALLRSQTPVGTLYDISTTFIWQELIWAGVSYRNTDEITVMAAIEPLPRLRFAYSIDLGAGNVSAYNNGTHELSLRYHFGHKIKTVGPKFF